jgi:C4-dicarboxylate transporter DctM subunit
MFFKKDLGGRVQHQVKADDSSPAAVRRDGRSLGHRLGAGIDFMSEIVGACAGYIMLFNSAIITLEVILRHFFRSPTIWVFDISCYLLVWFGFFSISYGLKAGSHISVDIFTSKMSARVKALFEVISDFVCIIYALVLFYYGTELCLEHYASMELQPTVLYFPVYLVEVGMVIGTFFMVLQSIRLFIGRIAVLAGGNLESGVGLLNTPPLILPFYLGLIAVGIWLYAAIPPLGIIVTLIILLAGGVPVFVTLGMIGSLGLFLLLGADSGLPQTAVIAVSSLDNFVILAIPLYILAGQILMASGIGSELYDVCYRWIGHFPGGIAAATVGSCAIFAAISGSSVATAAAIGIIALPEMLQRNYDKRLAYGVVAAGGTLGIMIPPSAAMIIYSGITDESTGALFIGGIIPGIILTVLFCAFAMISCAATGKYSKIPPFSWGARFSVFKSSFWALIAPILVIGSIYSGIATPTEAAALSVIYALIVSLIRGTIRFGRISEIMSTSVGGSGMILTIVIGAMLLGAITTFLQVPQKVIDLVTGMNLPNWAVMAFLCLMYIVLGMFLEVISILLITMPIVYPLIIHLGYNGVWYGVFIVALMEMALITPPVGLNIFVIQGIAKASMSDVVRGVFPFMLLLVVGLLLMWFFPQLVLYLPGTMGLGR